MGLSKRCVSNVTARAQPVRFASDGLGVSARDPIVRLITNIDQNVSIS